MRRDQDSMGGSARSTSPAPNGLRPFDPPRGEGGAIVDGAARVAFREGVDAGTIEILSFDASGACVVHKVGGLALGNLAVLAVGAMRRASSGVR